MHTKSLPLLSSLLYLSSIVTSVHSASSKRGFVYVTPASPSDDEIWSRPSNDITWYYNYVSTPTAALASASHLSFVPMLWGAPPSPTSDDTSFLDSITSQLSSGANITHILAYNEPDGTTSTGGSNLSPDAAANTWLRNIKPLRDDHGVKVGLPAVTGSPGGIRWLENFNASCATLNPDEGCAADFIPIHWYGNFEGLASHIGLVRALYPNIPMWVTEYALPNSELEETQAFYNISAEYFDRLEYVDRYSYFGAFRSSKSNVGGNAAFLTQNGELTDIGSWYLGGGATGNVPEGKAGRRTEASTLSVLGFVSAVVLLLVGC